MYERRDGLESSWDGLMMTVRSFLMASCYNTFNC